jgi:uncharacterized CHY-type Zn-finger protein
MKTKKRKAVNRKVTASFCAHKSAYEEIITLEECKKCFSKFDLTDQRILEIKNSVIGLVDGVINTYLDSF